MKYEYNGNLLFEDRIALVSNEIIKAYPELKKNQAIFIATLEPPISTKVNDEIKFKRLYNIMFATQKNKEFQKNIFKEITIIYKNLFNKNDTIDSVMNKLSDYMSNGGTFPQYS